MNGGAYSVYMDPHHYMFNFQPEWHIESVIKSPLYAKIALTHPACNTFSNATNIKYVVFSNLFAPEFVMKVDSA